MALSNISLLVYTFVAFADLFAKEDAIPLAELRVSEDSPVLYHIKHAVGGS